MSYWTLAYGKAEKKSNQPDYHDI